MSSKQIPDTMRALLYNQPVQELKLVDAWPTPTPDFTKGEYLLKVHSFAITKDELTWPFPPEVYKDFSPGVEMAGTVVASPSTSKFPAGSRVYLRISSPRSGAAREYCIALENELAFQPRNATPEQSASIPVSALTAWQALFVQAGFSPTCHGSQVQPPTRQKKRVLIIGASGSVGAWAIQFARLSDYYVVGMCQTRNLAMVRGLGADVVIDYTTTSVRQWLESNNAHGTFDLILDCAIPGGTNDNWYAAHPNHGLVLTIIPERAGLKWVLDRPEGISEKVEGRFFIMKPDGTQLRIFAELIDEGKVRPIVDSVFEFEEYEKAFARAEGGKATGKVIVRVERD